MNQALGLGVTGMMLVASIGTANASGGVTLDCYGVKDDSLQVLQVIQDISGKYHYSAQSCTPISSDGTPTKNAACEGSNGEIFKSGAGLVFGSEGNAYISSEEGQFIRFEDPSKNITMNFLRQSCKF